MTDEELAAIRKRVEACSGHSHGPRLAEFREAADDDVPELLAEVERLRGLIKAVEWERQGDPHWTQCPWGCVVETNWDARADGDERPIGNHGYKHAPECPAFHEDGRVK